MNLVLHSIILAIMLLSFVVLVLPLQHATAIQHISNSPSSSSGSGSSSSSSSHSDHKTSIEHITPKALVDNLEKKTQYTIIPPTPRKIAHPTTTPIPTPTTGTGTTTTGVTTGVTIPKTVTHVPIPTIGHHTKNYLAGYRMACADSPDQDMFVYTGGLKHHTKAFVLGYNDAWEHGTYC